MLEHVQSLSILRSSGISCSGPYHCKEFEILALQLLSGNSQSVKVYSNTSCSSCIGCRLQMH